MIGESSLRPSCGQYCFRRAAAPAIVGAAKLLPLTGTTLPSLSMAFTPQAATDSVRSASAPGTPLPATGARPALRPRPQRTPSLLAKSVPTLLCSNLLVSELSSRSAQPRVGPELVSKCT